MSRPSSPTAPLVISAEPFDISMSGPPPGLSSNILPSDAMNIDLSPQSEHAVSPSLGIPPIPVLPPAPAGSPTQQGTDTWFKALGPDSEFRKTVLTLETLREKAPTGILCTDEDILEWARQFAATWTNFELLIHIADYSFNSYPRPLDFETRMNQLIKYFARFVSLSWDFGGPPAWREKYQLLIAAEHDPRLPPGHDADAAYAIFGTSSIQPGDFFFEDRTNIEDRPADKEEEQDQLEEDSVSQGPRHSSPVASHPKPSTPQDRSNCEFPVLGFDGLYPPQEWVHVEGIHGHRYHNYAHFALPSSELKEEIANCKACGDTYETINGRLMILMNPDFKHQSEHGAWIYCFVKPCHYCDYLQVSCIGQDGASCGCCSSVGLNCPNLTYRPPSVGANPKTLFIPPGWDWEPPVKPKFSPPTKASKTPASLKTLALKPIQEEKMGPPSRVSKFSAIEVNESDIEEVVIVNTSASKPPRKRQVVPLLKASAATSSLKSSATIPYSTSNKVLSCNAKFFQGRKRASSDSEVEAVPHSSIIEAVVMEFGPSIVAEHVERYVKKARTG
ncbi:uncharacterized protein ARMOST_22151 [Armillaria ostoyae]|uniref:Uncharacterized protein n=1 Tax=Armillaria ostoyae TaxID=47428 RepID=A0A284SC28_ARMOS|nr:uncharacterized protein ARMOST_22151 [Armillaria ostoyae]